MPVLQLFLPRNSITNAIEMFKIQEVFALIMRSEGRAHTIFMFLKPSIQVISNPNIESCPAVIGENINIAFIHQWSRNSRSVMLNLSPYVSHPELVSGSNSNHQLPDPEIILKQVQDKVQGDNCDLL